MTKRWLCRPYESDVWKETDIQPTDELRRFLEFKAMDKPVDGLETVGYVTTSPTGAEGFQRKPLVPGHGQFGYKQDAVVARSQADELLAAERAETMRQVKHWSELYKQQHYRAEKAEADNAALTAKISVGDDRIRNLKLENETLTARVKELENLCDHGEASTLTYAEKCAELETQLDGVTEENRKLRHDLAIFYKDNVSFEARSALEAKP